MRLKDFKCLAEVDSLLNLHDALLTPKKPKMITCPGCGIEFEFNPSAPRKYHSKACRQATQKRKSYAAKAKVRAEAPWRKMRHKVMREERDKGELFSCKCGAEVFVTDEGRFLYQGPHCPDLYRVAMKAKEGK